MQRFVKSGLSHREIAKGVLYLHVHFVSLANVRAAVTLYELINSSSELYIHQMLTTYIIMRIFLCAEIVVPFLMNSICNLMYILCGGLLELMVLGTDCNNSLLLCDYAIHY